MADDTQNIIDKAETRFLETQKKNADKARAMAEYLTKGKLREQKTARLRSLRLARDEADRAAEAAKPAPIKKKRAAAKAASA